MKLEKYINHVNEKLYRKNMNIKKLIYHGTFVLVLSSILTSGIVYAQQKNGASSFLLGPMPKLIVFIVSSVVSLIADILLMLALDGHVHIPQSILMSVPFVFLNIYWFDYIAPAVGNQLLTIRFMQVGDPSWNYWIGINLIVVFILDFVLEQIIFRFARGAATSPNWQDALDAAIDTFLPPLLFIALPMLGII